jgi:uncharacterized membrane protein
MESQIVENKINIDKITQITKKVNIKIVFITFLLLLLGVAAIGIEVFREQSNAWTDNVLIFIGIVLIIWAVVWFFLKKKKYVYSETGSTVKPYNYYILREQMETIKMLLSQAAFSLAKPIRFQENGNVCIKVFTSVDKRFAAVQIFEYASFSFQAITDVYTYTDAQASDFIAFLDKCKVEM